MSNIESNLNSIAPQGTKYGEKRAEEFKNTVQRIKERSRNNFALLSLTDKFKSYIRSKVGRVKNRI